MCTTCGCGHQEMSQEMHRLGIAHGHGKTVDITVEQDILSEQFPDDAFLHGSSPDGHNRKSYTYLFNFILLLICFYNQ